MKKILSKAMAVIMAAALCVGMCATALAADDVTAKATDTGTITISGLEAGVTVNAYKIAEATYDESTGYFTGYKMLYTAGGFSIDQYGNYEESALTEANMAALYKAVEDASAQAVKTVTSNADGTATFSDMAVGSYLFVVEGLTTDEAAVYGMVIGSVYYAADDEGNWTLENGTVAVQGTNNWVKYTKPSVEKTETGGHLTEDSHGGSADVGDELTYHITVSPIPSYQGSYPEFKVVDTIDSKLIITDEELEKLTVVVNGTTLTKDVDYTVTSTPDSSEGTHTFTIDFVVNGTYTLNEYAGAGSSIVITYGATVVEAGDKNADDADHKNDVELDYTTTSYVSGHDSTDKDEDHDYTFNARILKTEKIDQEEVALPGATFALYTDSTCNTPYTQNGTAITAVSGEDGYFEFTGLEEGTYYMKETEAPAGYALNTTIYKIVIEATYSTDVDHLGELVSFTITVYDGDTAIGSALVSNTTAAISNIKTSALPSTGGIGTTIFYVIGGVLVAGAVVVLVTRRRMNHEA